MDQQSVSSLILTLAICWEKNVKESRTPEPEDCVFSLKALKQNMIKIAVK